MKSEKKQIILDVNKLGDENSFKQFQWRVTDVLDLHTTRHLFKSY